MIRARLRFLVNAILGKVPGKTSRHCHAYGVDEGCQ